MRESQERVIARIGEELVVRHRLEPHPEGGFFRRVYESPLTVDTPGGRRPLATSIYYLLTAGAPSAALHRNKSDIVHYLLEGGPVTYLTTADGARLDEVTLSEGGERTHLVPGGVWKATRLAAGASHALVSELVTPGFDYADHEFGTAELPASPPGVRDRLAEFVRAAGLSPPVSPGDRLIA